MVQTSSPRRPPQTAIVPDKWLRCNGRQFRKLMQAALTSIEAHYEEINALNVFPVPDGDTGTNMLLTLRSAVRRIQDREELHVGQVAQEAAQGALMGARGNSGVILSQILRGLARAFQGHDSFDAPLLAEAFEQATATAYAGVMQPVEGTILTIIRAGAGEARDAAQKSPDLRFLLERVVERCRQALERTPEQLPVLKQAGVVDSGGQGLVYIFEGMLRYVRGELADQPLAAAAPARPAQALAVPESGHLENPYDVQFILLGRELDVTAVRECIDAMGDSTVVVGDAETIKVHVHVKDPGVPISYAIGLGQLTDVVVENMQMQMEAIVDGEAAPTAAPAVRLAPDQLGVVTVAAGAGLADIFRSLGAAAVVDGGQTNNPSTEELLAAIAAAPTDKVILLPNNKNIILAAEAAAGMSAKEVAVVPTRTVPQGIAAMLGANPNGELAATVAAMKAAAAAVTTGEITVATRAVTLDGVAVEAGALIGLADGRLCASGDHVADVIRDTLAAMAAGEHELVSLYYGADVTEADATAIRDLIESLYPELETELLPGGQPHYLYLLSAE